ncbi:MAG: hypothetical protein ACRYG8_23380 [Janthinobacterium lividum]
MGDRALNGLGTPGGFGTMKIVQSNHMPIRKIPGPMAIHRSKGHPLVYWLSRQLARVGIALEPDMLTPYQAFIDDPELRVWVIGDSILVHPRHYDALMRFLREEGRSAGRT